MNTKRPAAGPRTERDFDWMESTYPLNTNLIQHAIDELAADNAQARRRGERTPDGRQQARLLQSGSLHARVTGPVGGYYIASCANRTDDSNRAYVGEYKICEDAPSSYWAAESLVAGSCRHTERSGMAAMASAEGIAARRIADMPIRVDRA